MRTRTGKRGTGKRGTGRRATAGMGIRDRNGKRSHLSESSSPFLFLLPQSLFSLIPRFPDSRYLMPRPIVALTATTKDIGGMMRVRLNEAYVDAVREAGLVPLIVPPLEPNEVAPIMDAVAGLILTGGEDVDPAEYGATRHTETTSVHGRRDKCEIAMLKIARERKMPTLAICRGIQVANVALGGTLVQDIPSERPSELKH